MKYERDFDQQKEPEMERFPGWVLLLFWSCALGFGAAVYVGIFYLLLWLFP